jgi:hypothetical protein
MRSERVLRPHVVPGRIVFHLVPGGMAFHWWEDGLDLCLTMGAVPKRGRVVQTQSLVVAVPKRGRVACWHSSERVPLKGSACV